MSAGDATCPDVIGIWHVGARDGYLPIEWPAELDQSSEFVLFDADPGAVGGAVRLADGRVSSARHVVVPSALDSSEGDGDFRKTACPYAAGLAVFDEQFGNWSVFGNGSVDYILGEAHQLVGVERLPCTTLDAVWNQRRRHGIHATASLLIIDAQGSSLAILEGGAQSLLPQVDVVIAEVELIPFYGGMPSFAGALPWLTARGFWFADFLPENSPWATPVRRPLGQRSGTLRGSADAIFIRDPAALKDQSAQRRGRYAVTCAAVGYLDLACEAVANFTESELATVHGFARALKLATDALERVFPPSFRDSRNGSWETDIRSEFFGLTGESTPIEECLEGWGLNKLAKRVKGVRLTQVRELLEKARRVSAGT